MSDKAYCSNCRGTGLDPLDGYSCTSCATPNCFTRTPGPDVARLVAAAKEALGYIPDRRDHSEVKDRLRAALAEHEAATNGDKLDEQYERLLRLKERKAATPGPDVSRLVAAAKLLLHRHRQKACEELLTGAMDRLVAAIAEHEAATTGEGG